MLRSVAAKLPSEGARRKMSLGQLSANVDAVPADERAEFIAAQGDPREGRTLWPRCTPGSVGM